MGGLIRQAAMRGSLSQIRYVAPIAQHPGGSLASQVSDQAEREFGMLAPPISLHDAAPELMAACWLMLRETMVADGRVERAIKEAVAASVSVSNTCPYCVAVHGATLRSFMDGSTAHAVSGDHVGSIADPTVRNIALWARTGGASDAGVQRTMPFTNEQAPEIIGVATTFQYLNRMVNVFLGNSPLPSAIPTVARGGMMRGLGWLMRAAAIRSHEPGIALDLLPDATLPGDLSWAAGNTYVAQAFARAIAAIEEGGRRSVPTVVRKLVSARISTWHGEAMGPSRAWVEEVIVGLPPAAEAAARLALLTALASFQVDQDVVDAFRGYMPTDRTLVELTSWASLTAARRAASWMWVREDRQTINSHATDPNSSRLSSDLG
jgi:AhpD family alkylhydroperoxidase